MITKTLVCTGSFYREENWKYNQQHGSICSEAVYVILGHRLPGLSDEKIKVYASKERIHKRGCKRIEYISYRGAVHDMRIDKTDFCLHPRLENALIELGLVAKEVKNDFFYAAIEELEKK